MGLAMPPSSLSLKRNAAPSDFALPVAKRTHSRFRQHHHLKWSTEDIENSKAFDQDNESAEALLRRSVALALKAVGFEHAEPAAIEALQTDAEEYMAHFLSHVRQTMLACRRSRTTPEDFLQALHLNNLSLRALLPHLDPPVPASQSQRRLDIDDVEGSESTIFASSSRILFRAQAEEQRAPYIPSHMPALPSKHSYRETIELPTRERDSRKIRERATEEGRIGEEALRRLLGGKKERSYPFSPRNETAPMSESMRLKTERQQLWQEAMQLKSFDDDDDDDDDAAAHNGGGNIINIDFEDRRVNDGSGNGTSEARHLSTGVNYEKRYWRTPAPQGADKTSNYGGTG